MPLFRASTPPQTNPLFDRYVDAAPSAQNAVDAVPGWVTALPEETGASGGTIALTQDDRIAWMIQTLGGIAGARVLELGPLDGGHTAMLHAAGAASIEAVEANRLAFLRCLILKNLLGLERVRFHHGDITLGFGAAEGRYDLIVASGILYHLAYPGRLLVDLAKRTDRLFLWSHVYDADALVEDDPRRAPFTGEVAVVEHAGVKLRLHQRRYLGSEHQVSFCGGPRDAHVWMEREGLFELLTALGFDRLRTAHDDPAAPGGPALSILADRSNGP